jgi:hypothetical protein
LSEQLVKPMEDLEGEYMPWIEMPDVGCSLNKTSARSLPSGGQNTHLRTAPKFSVQMHALLGSFPTDSRRATRRSCERWYGLVKRRNDMRCVFLPLPKAAGHCRRYQMPDQLHSETELCELLVGLCAVGE